MSRQRNGAVLHAHFESHLPGGSMRGQSGRDAFRILDCTWDEAQQTYWVMDLMCWAGHALYDCSAEFRIYWLTSKLAEVADEAAASQQPKLPSSDQVHSCTDMDLESSGDLSTQQLLCTLVLPEMLGLCQRGTQELTRLTQTANQIAWGAEHAAHCSQSLLSNLQGAD